MKSEVQLTPLRISNGALQVKGMPRRLKLLNWGVNQTVYGPVIVNETTAALLPMNQKKLGFDTIALDYEHNTVPKTPEYERTREPREIAANCVPLVVPGEGLFVDALEYTPSGKQNHMNYIDLSPTPRLSALGEVVFLHSVALCRQGAVEDLHYFSVSLDKPEDMQEEPNQENRTMKELMAFLKKVFKLPDTATDEDVMKAFQGAVSVPSEDGGEAVPMSASVVSIRAALKPLQALVAADGKLTTLSAGFAGIQTRLGDVNVQEKITTLSTAIEGVSKDVACFMARIAGKVVPLSAADLAKTPLETLTSMIAALPVTVPVGQLTPLNVQSTPAAGAGLSEQDKTIAARLGYSEAEVASANGIKV